MCTFAPAQGNARKVLENRIISPLFLFPVSCGVKKKLANEVSHLQLIELFSFPCRFLASAQQAFLFT